MNKKVKYMLSAIGEHLLYILMSLALMFVLGALFQKCLWMISVITGLLYLSSIYSTGWSNSGRDLRAAKAKAKEEGTDILDYRIYTGFIYPIPLLVLSALIFTLNAVFGSYFTVLFRVYNFAFVYFLDIGGIPDMIVEVVITLLPYVFYGLGYIAGKNKRVFVSKYLYKLVYKTKKDDRKN